MSQTKPPLASFDRATQRIGCLSVSEWCRYWDKGNGQYIDDGLGIESSVRDELAEASALIRRMAALLDSVEVGAESFSEPRFHSLDGRNWFDVREQLTGKPSHET